MSRWPARSPTCSSHRSRPCTATSTPAPRRFTSSTSATRYSSRSPTRPTPTWTRSSGRRACKFTWARASRRSARPRAVLGRHDDRDALRYLGWRIKAAPVAADGGIAQGRGGRVDVEPDLTLAGHAGVYVIGDIANIPDGQRRAAAVGLGRDAERHLGGQEHPGRLGGQAAHAVCLPRQGDHGDDRSGCRDRRSR